MDKGDETKRGVYLGERVVPRDQRLADLEKLPKSYEDRIPADGPAIFADNALAHVFEQDGEEVVVLFEDYK